MCTIDIVMLVLVVGMSIWGFVRGVVRQIGDLTGLILGIIGANLWGNACSVWLQAQTNWSLIGCQIVAYIGVFLLIYLTARIVALFIRALTRLVKLGWIDSVLGGLFSAFKFLLLTSVILNLLMLVTKDAQVWRSEELTRAECYEPMKGFAPKVLHVVWNKTTNMATELLNE